MTSILLAAAILGSVAFLYVQAGHANRLVPVTVRQAPIGQAEKSGDDQI